MTRLPITSHSLIPVASYARRYLAKKFPYVEQRQAFLWNDMAQEPMYWACFLKNKYSKSNHDLLKKLYSQYLKKGFFFFCGAKGSGKTTLIYFFYQYLRNQGITRPIYVRNCEPVGDMRVLEDFNILEPYKGLPHGAILFHDEVQNDIEPTMTVNSKEYIALKGWFGTQRHRGQTVIHISQTTMQFMKSLLRYCDGQIYLKTSMMKTLEREEFMPYIVSSQTMLDNDNFNFIFINDREVFQVYYDRPSIMTEEGSFYYANKKNKSTH